MKRVQFIPYMIVWVWCSYGEAYSLWYCVVSVL